MALLFIWMKGNGGEKNLLINCCFVGYLIKKLKLMYIIYLISFNFFKAYILLIFKFECNGS